jgi:hypothetical protein
MISFIGIVFCRAIVNAAYVSCETIRYRRHGHRDLTGFHPVKPDGRNLGCGRSVDVSRETELSVQSCKREKSATRRNRLLSSFSKGDAIVAQSRVFGHHQHLIEEGVHRFAQARQPVQGFTV